MDVLERKFEFQVQFWSLLGPFIIILSIAILLFKVSAQWYFPLSAIIGIPLCVKWKMKGMVAALSFLLLLSVIAYQRLDLDEQYWHVGMAMAMAFSFIIFTLSLEEVQGLVNKMQLESQSRLNNFLTLDEKWKGAEFEWAKDKEKFIAEKDVLSQELVKVQEEKQTFYKLAQLAKDELSQVRNQHDLLLQDLLYKKQQIAQLNERLEETEMTIQEFINSDAENQIKILTDRSENLEREKETLRAQFSLQLSQAQETQKENEQLWLELLQCQEQVRLSVIEQQRYNEEKLEQQNLINELSITNTQLENTKSTLLEAQANLQKQIEQVKDLEREQKQNILNQQQKIIELEAKLALACQQTELFKHEKLVLEDQILCNNKELKLREEELQKNISKLKDQLEEHKQNADAHREQFNQEIAKQSLQEKKALEQEIKTLKEHYHQSQDSLRYLQNELKANEETIAHLKQTLDKHIYELQEQRHLTEKRTALLQVLEESKQSLEKAVQEKQTLLDQALQQIESLNKQHVQAPIQLKNSRSIESVYAQLKQQFEEKSSILDSTRSELFHLKEELLKNRMDYDEEHVFDQSENEKYLEKEFLHLGRQFEQMQVLYQQEIDELVSLISSLLGQMRNIK